MSKINHEALAGARNKLINEIVLFNNEEFNERYAPNKWTAAQVCHHLVLTEKIFSKVIIHGLKKPESNKAENKDISSIMMDRTRKVPAPEIVEPGSEPMEVRQIIDLLNESRARFLEVLSTIEDESKLAEHSAKHPVYGELSLEQWIDLLYLHEQRHTEQLKEIKMITSIRE
jgi:uncharacterized damage-inducible protein DinB